MNGAEIDVLYKPAKVYPRGVDDGDLPSRLGRDSLWVTGLVRRDAYGGNYLTAKGYATYQERAGAK